jgi:hypothetical protein
LTLRSVAGAGREQVEAVTESLEYLDRRQHLHTRGRQLESQRKAVQSVGDLAHGVVGLERRLELSCPLGEQRDRLSRRKGRNSVFLLADDVEALTARGEDLGTESRHEWCDVGEQLLEVVEQEKEPLSSQVLGQGLAGAEHVIDRRFDQSRITDGRKRDEPDAVGMVVNHFSGGLQSESRLARATGARERDERVVIQQFHHLAELVLAPDERARLYREIRRVQALERGKVGITELIDPLRRCEVLESVVAEVTQAVGTCELAH